MTLITAPAPLLAGPPGKSAYALAVELGFVGTLAQWVASLQGQNGVGLPGDPGPAGPGVIAVAQTFSGDGSITTGTTYAGVTTVSSGGVNLALPAVGVSPRGFQVTIADESGNCSSANPINVNPNGSDTISGQAGVKLIVPYQRITLVSNNVNLWIAP